MGIVMSLMINEWVVDYIKSLQTDEGVYTVDELETEFALNQSPGSNNAPRCHMFIKKSSIQCQDLNFDTTTVNLINMKSSKIVIDIGEAVVTCHDLGYILRISGRITIFDVNITTSFKLLENYIGVSDIGSEIAVKKIWSEIELSVNGTNHSRLAKVLLSTDNSQAASNLLNAAFMFQKENIKELLNKYCAAIVREGKC